MSTSPLQSISPVMVGGLQTAWLPPPPDDELELELEDEDDELELELLDDEEEPPDEELEELELDDEELLPVVMLRSRLIRDWMTSIPG